MKEDQEVREEKGSSRKMKVKEEDELVCNGQFNYTVFHTLYLLHTKKLEIPMFVPDENCTL